MCFFKQKTAYELLRSLVGSEMCIIVSRSYALCSGRSGSADPTPFWPLLDPYTAKVRKVALKITAAAVFHSGSPYIASGSGISSLPPVNGAKPLAPAARSTVPTDMPKVVPQPLRHGCNATLRRHRGATATPARASYRTRDTPIP